MPEKLDCMHREECVLRTIKLIDLGAAGTASDNLCGCDCCADYDNVLINPAVKKALNGAAQDIEKISRSKA